jgi:hypothetical protein
MSAHEADGVRRIFGEIGIGEQPAPERPKDIMSNMTGSDFPGHKPHLRIAPAKPQVLLLTSKQFIDGFTPPAYLIDGIVQRGYLYALTARTGHGKTAVDMYIAQAIARSQPVHGRETKGGTVLFLAGENPDDIRARFPGPGPGVQVRHQHHQD